MINKNSSVLMITEEDIEQLLTEWGNVPQWVKAHVSTKCPAHRYEGELMLNDESLIFHGRDIGEGKDCELELPLNCIAEVYIGFSKHLKASIDPAFGMGGPEPFAIRYKNNGESQTVYFNTSSDRYPPHRRINNLRWYETLDTIVTKYRLPNLEGEETRSSPACKQFPEVLQH